MHLDATASGLRVSKSLISPGLITKDLQQNALTNDNMSKVNGVCLYERLKNQIVDDHYSHLPFSKLSTNPLIFKQAFSNNATK